MKLSITLTAIIAVIFITSPTSWAKKSPKSKSKTGGKRKSGMTKQISCTQTALDAAEAYDPAMPSTTQCIKYRSDINIVVSWQNNIKNGKIFNTSGSTVSQQAVNVRNLSRDYETNYGMEHGKEFNVVVVAYFNGVDWLRKTSDQANQDFIKNNVLDRGIKIYACQNTMKAKGLKLSDLIDGILTVPAGVTAVVDFQLQGMTYLNP